MVDDAYLQSAVRVLLIGQEPKKWGKDLHSLAADGNPPTALRSYVQGQMAAYRNIAAMPARRSRFLTKDIKNALFDAVGAVADEKRPQ